MRKFLIWKGVIIVFLVFLAAFFLAVRFLLPVIQFAQKNSISPSFIYNFFFKEDVPLKKTNERTNVLILGIAGGSHPGSDLTDTMIFLSLNYKNQRTSLISLPRDVWSDTLRDKINSAYHYGEEKEEGRGLGLTDAIVEEILNQPIHYTFLIDFNLFSEIIDLVGGINVQVEKTFDDYKYPIDGREDDLCDGDPEFMCRYEHIHFEAGWQKMDGAAALRFIRSRNAEGEEGSDFARGKRQQKILEALKNRLMSKEIIRNPKLLITIWEVFENNSKLSATLSDILYLGKQIAAEKERKTIPIEEHFASAPSWMYGGRWVLVPKVSWQAFHRFIEESLE